MAVNPDDPLSWEDFPTPALDRISKGKPNPKVNPDDPLTWEDYPSAIKTSEQEEPGYAGALVRGIGAGFRRRLPEMVGQAIQFGTSPLLEEGAVSPGEKLAKWATEGEKRPEFKSAIKEALYSGGEMLAPSVAPAIALGPLGVGGTAASAITGGLFGLSQAQQTLDTAKEAGVEPGMAPYATGAIEAAGETLGTMYLTRLLGPLAPLFTKGGKTSVRQVVRPTVGRLVREVPKTLGVEIGTEMGQNFGEAYVEQLAGVRPEAQPVKEALSAIGPTAVLTGITGALGLPMGRIRSRAAMKALQDPKVDPALRQSVVNEVSAVMGEADPEIGAKWKARAYQDLAGMKPIDLDQDIFEYLGIREPTAPETPAEKEAPKKAAIPMEEPHVEPEEEKGAPPPEEPMDLTTLQKGPVTPPEPAPADWVGLEKNLAEAQGKPAKEKKQPTFTESQVERALSRGTIDLNAPEGERIPPTPAAPVAPKPEEKPAAIPKAVDEEEISFGPEDYKAVETKKTKEPAPELKGVKTKGYFTAPEMWEKKVGETVDEWADHLANLENLEKELDKKGEPHRKELKELKGKRDKESVARRQEIEKEIERLYEPVIGKQAEAEDQWIAENEKFMKMVHEEALKRRVPEEDLDSFLEYFSDMASPERPAIEHNAHLTHRQVFEMALKDYFADRKAEEKEIHQKTAIREKVGKAGAEAATSPESAIPEPTEAQKEAGNYKKGHVSIHGLDISIENPRGSTRSGVSPEGKPWETKLAHDYGYIRGTKGKDKDHLDVFIGPNPESLKAFVVDQLDSKGEKFDEHKIMLGFNALEEARAGYLANYEPGWKGLGAMTEMDMDRFKEWLKGDTTKPVSFQPEVTHVKDRSKTELAPGFTYRKIADMLLDPPQRQEALEIVRKVKGPNGATILHNLRNELMVAAKEHIDRGRDMEKMMQQAADAGEALVKAFPPEAIPNIPQPQKAAIPEAEKRPLDQVLADLASGKISPEEAQQQTGLDLMGLLKEFETYINPKPKTAIRETQQEVKRDRAEVQKDFKLTPGEVYAVTFKNAEGRQETSNMLRFEAIEGEGDDMQIVFRSAIDKARHLFTLQSMLYAKPEPEGTWKKAKIVPTREGVKAIPIEEKPAQKPQVNERLMKIAEASRKPEPDVVPIYRLKGTDGKWYRAGGFPLGVNSTGEKKLEGFAVRTDQGTTVGKMEPTREAVLASWKKGQDANVKDFYERLLEMDEGQIRSQEAYWLKKAPPAASAKAEEKPGPAKGFAAEMLAEGKWTRNSIIFPTREEAEKYGDDLFNRWMGAKDKRIIEVDEKPNYNYRDGELQEIKETKPEAPVSKPEETKDTITYTFKKEFEEQNRKNVESLSYVGKLIKREEQPNDWVKLTYQKVVEPAKPEEKAAPVPERPEKYYWVNPETHKLELHFSKADFDALPEKAREDIRRYFLWAPSKKVWVSKGHKSGSVYWAKQRAEAAGLKEWTGKPAEEKPRAEAKPAEPSPEWEKAFRERLRYISPAGKVIRIEFAEGGNLPGGLVVSRNVEKSGPEEAVRKLRTVVFDQLPNLKPLSQPEKEKPRAEEKKETPTPEESKQDLVKQIEALKQTAAKAAEDRYRKDFADKFPQYRHPVDHHGSHSTAAMERFYEQILAEETEKRKGQMETLRKKLERLRAGKKPAEPRAEEKPVKSQFKVGDTVQVTDESKLNVGFGGTVTSISRDPLTGEPLIATDDREQHFPAKDFELAKQEPAEEPRAEEKPARENLKIPYEAVKYANAIANKIKKTYAWAYLNFAAGKTPDKPTPRGLSATGAQIIRQSIDDLLEKAYPDTYQRPAEVPAHATRPEQRGGTEFPEQPEVRPAPGVAHGPRAGTREGTLPEQPGEAQGRGGQRGPEEHPAPGHEGEPGRGRAGGRAAVPGGRPAPEREAPERPGKEGAPRVERQPLAPEERNYRLAPDEELAPTGKIARVKANVSAILLAKKLDAEKRNATPEEKKILAQFSGWGSLQKEAFEGEEFVRYDEEKDGKLRESSWIDPEDRRAYEAWYNRIGKALHPDLDGVMTQEEWNEAKSSILNAFYTSREVIQDGLWPIVQRLGFKGGTVIEPSAGVGHILGLMPESMANRSEIVAVEKDKLSGLVLKKLYPQANVQVAGYEDVRAIADNSADLVISNFPFGDISVFDKHHKDYSMWSIHNYFFARSIDAVRPGGLVVAITSHYTMDAKGPKVRDYIAKKADLVGGLRLPNNAFAKNAGTEVSTDILIFRKRDQSSGQPANPFHDLKPVKVEGNQTAWVNQYFIDNPDMVLGEHSLKGTMYGQTEKTQEGEEKRTEYATLPKKGMILSELLTKAITNLPENIAGIRPAVKKEEPKIFAEQGTKEGSVFLKDDKIVRNENGVLVPWATKKGQALAARRYISVRDNALILTNLERQEETAEKKLTEVRDRLNRAYDAFVKDHGPISDKANRWLSADAEYSFALSLEQEKKIPKEIGVPGEKRKILETVYEKAKIFNERTNFPFKEPTRADNGDDALKISMTYRNRVDPDYIASLLGLEDADQAKKMLVSKDLAFVNPDSGLLEAPFEYLSGNVRDKLQKAEEAAKDDPIYDKNVEALKKVQPEDLKIDQIFFRLGTPWIPTQSIEDFGREVLRMDLQVSRMQTEEMSRFGVTFTGNLSAEAKNNFGTERANAINLLDDSLNLRFTTIYDEWEEDKVKHRELNKEATAAAKDMQRRLNERFVEWAKNSEKWGPEYAQTYNRDMNNSILMEVPTPDLKHYPNASTEITLYPHQKRAVSRGLMQSCLLAHEVGTGKTFIFATMAMEMRRLGTARKPMIVVHNSTVHQYAKAFRQLYPTANIIVPDADRLEAKNRKKLLGQIATQDFDAIVVPQSWFDMLSVSPEKEAAYVQTQVAELEELIRQKEAEDEDKRKIRQIEKMKENKEARIRELLATGQKEELLWFEDLNIDALLIDEAHSYKRAEFFTKLPNVKGIDRGAAAKSTRLFLKSKEVLAKTGGKNIITATGTPISNTIAEAWAMLRYIRPDLLARFNSSDFDSFAGNFGTITQEVEETESGTFKYVERFARYVNGPELLKMWRQASDIILADDVDAPRPRIKGGKPRDLQLERPEELAELIQWIRIEREAWDNLPGRDKVESTHVPLMLFNLAKAASVDLRMVDSSFPDLPGSKVNRSVEEVFTRWRDTKEAKLTQVVFCGGLGTPFRSGDGRFNVFEDLKAKLIKRGVPKQEIAIIHDYGKKELEELTDKVNDGEIRIVMGTTDKLGIGANFQQRLMAAHHLDVPHRPMDSEQRNGRIWRPGNMNEEIEILYYGVKNTLDSTSFQRLLIKKKFVNQLLRGDITDRSFDDPFDPTQGSFEDMVAAFGNPKVREKFGLESNIRDLEQLRDSHNKEVGRARQEISYRKYAISADQKILPAVEKIMDQLRKAFPKGKIVSEETAFKWGEIEGRKEIGQAIQAETVRIQTMIEKEFKALQEEHGETSVPQSALKEVMYRAQNNIKDITITMNGIPVAVQPRPYSKSEETRYNKRLKENIGRPVFEGFDFSYEMFPGEEFRLSEAHGNYWRSSVSLSFSHSVNTIDGIVPSVSSTIGHFLEKPESSKKEIAKMEREILSLQEVIKSKFDREGELEEKKKRLGEVEAELRAIQAEGVGAADKEAEEREKQRLRDKYRHLQRRIYSTKEEKEAQEVAAAVREGRTPKIKGLPKGAVMPQRVVTTEGITKVSSEYYAYFEKPVPHFEKVQGKPVNMGEAYKDLDFFVHKTESGQWIIAEGKSGLSVAAGGATQSQAIQELKEKLDRNEEQYKPEALKELIDKAILDMGLSPRYKPGKQPTGEASLQLVEKAAPFYSALRRAIEAKMPNAMPAPQLVAFLKQPGIKQDEMKWSGLEAWLKDKTGKVTKADVVQFLDANRIEVNEVLKGGTREDIEITPEQRKAILDSLRENHEDGTIWVNQEDEEAVPIADVLDAALEGHPSALEILEANVPEELLTPIREGKPLFQEGGPAKYEEWKLPGGEDYRELLFTLPIREKVGANYTGPHWGEQNVLAHVRFDDRTGVEKSLVKGQVLELTTELPEEKVLFIEEVQSDWHQAGREKGYRSDFQKTIDEKEAQLQKASDAYTAFQTSMREKYGDDLHATDKWTREENDREHDLYYAWVNLREEALLYDPSRNPFVPDAPFAKTWHEFVLKRMIRWAAENGYDRIAWTTGKQQAQRYSLSKQIRELHYTPRPDKGDYLIAVTTKAGELHSLGPFTKDKLPETVGRELTNKILAGEGKPILEKDYEPGPTGEPVLVQNESRTRTLSGLDLEIGGHGMNAFYDKIIPDFLNKFGKKWGAKVEEVELKTPALAQDAEADLTITDEDHVLRTVHSLPITKEMKETAMREGFPMFQAGILRPHPAGWEKADAGAPARAVSHEELSEISRLVRRMVGSDPTFTDKIELDLNTEGARNSLKRHGYTDEEIEDLRNGGYMIHDVAGRMYPVETSPGRWKAIIQVALEGRTAFQVKHTAFHEAWEAARNFMLTDREHKLLEDRYPDLPEKATNERQADAFADWMMGKRRALVPMTIRGLFEKIKTFFERVRNFFQGMGFQTLEDIFQRVETGQVRKRYRAEGIAARPQGTEFKASLTEMQKVQQHLDRFHKVIRQDIEFDHAHQWDPYANVARDKVVTEVEKQLKAGKAPQDIFPALAEKYTEEYRTAVKIKSDPYDELARLTTLKTLEKDLRKIWPFDEVPITTVYDLGEYGQKLRKWVDALKSWDFSQKAEEEQGFKNLVKKSRLGLVKVTDPDLKWWEKVLSLPFWLHFKYRELRPLVHTQMRREEARATTIHELLVRGENFFNLKGEQLGRLEKAIVQGDKDKTVYDEMTLREVFKLDDAGVKGYRAVRDTLNWIHREWREKIQENFLREFESERWFVLFKAAHDFELSPEETTRLADALKKTYRAQEMPLNTVRRHLQKIFREKLTQNDKRLLVKNYVEAWKIAKAQLLEIKNIVRDAIGEDMSDEELNKATKALVQAYVRTEPQATHLKEMRDELNRLKGYFPRSRKMGKFRVVVEQDVEDQLGNQVPMTLYLENASNRIEATRIYNRLVADPKYKGLRVRVRPNQQEPETTFMGASTINLQRLVDNAITRLKDQGEVDPDAASQIRMNVLEVLADQLKARGAGRFAIRRAGHIIEGYQVTNLKEVLKDYIDGWSGMMTKQDAALQFLEELKGIPQNKPQLMGYASKYAQDMLRNQETADRVTQKIRSLAFVYFLGGSLRAAAVNFTQNFVTGIPFYAREVGYKSLRAEKDYGRAMYEVATGKNLSEVEKKMLDEMINKGIAEDQYIRQITREVKGGVGKTLGRVVDFLAKPFSLIEIFNRKSSALVMFRAKYAQYRAAKIDEENAYRRAFAEAEDFVYKTHYLMSKANLPSVAAGGDTAAHALRTAYTFRRFTHNYLLSLQHSFTGPDGKAALDVIGRSLAYIALLGGIPALPFLDDLLDLWERLFGTPVRSSIRKTMRAVGGPILEQMGMAGIPAIIGVDISGSLKTQVPFMGMTPSDTIYGVYGGMLDKAKNATASWQRDDSLRAIEFASPSFLEAALKAYRMTEKGATTPTGKVLTDEQGKPIRLRAPEAVAQTIGFRPSRLSGISGEHRTMTNVQSYFNSRRDDLYSRYRLARTPEEKSKVITDMQKFNMDTRKYRGLIPPITTTSLRQAAKQRPEKAFLAFGRMKEADI